MTIRKIITYLFYLLVFLLPFQTRYIYEYGYLNGGIWEYGTFSIFGTQILLWLIVILFAWYKFKQKQLWRVTFSKSHFKKHYWRLIFVVAFLLFNFINVYLSINSDISYQHWLWVLGSMCLAIVLLDKDSKIKADKALIIFWLSGLLQSVLAIYQFGSQRVWSCKWLGMASQNPLDGGVSVIAFDSERYLRAYGSFSWPNSLGAFLAVCLVLGLILIIKRQKDTKQKRLLFTIGQLIIATGLILSFSRGAWLATIMGIIVLGLVARQDWRVIVVQSFYYVILSLLFIITLAPLFNARFDLNNSVEMTSYTEHTQQYAQATDVVKNYNLWDKNLWLGLGQGTYTLNLYNYDQSLEAWQYQPAHNIYVLWLTEMGVLGLIVYLLIYLFIIKHVWQYSRLFIPVILVMLIHGLFDHWWWTLNVGVLIWWVILAISSPKTN